MEPSRPPTAADLGVTEVEYERIVRGLHQRGVPTGAPVGAPQATTRPPPRAWPVLLALGVFAAICLSVARHASEHDPPPAYAFLDTGPSGLPVTYSSCKPVPIAIYPAGGPPEAADLVREAVAQVRAATGLDLVVTGVFGGYAPNWNFEAAPVSTDDPISVSWHDQADIAGLTTEVAGLGGSRVAVTANGGERLTAGTIALSRDVYARLAQQGDRAEAVAILIHELGHVLGLAHVSSHRELMSEDNVGQTTLGPGDREGFRLVGNGPCF